METTATPNDDKVGGGVVCFNFQPKNKSLKIIHALHRLRIQAVDMNGAEQQTFDEFHSYYQILWLNCKPCSWICCCRLLLFLCLFVCLFVRSFVRLFVCLFVCLCVCVFVFCLFFVCLCVCVFVFCLFFVCLLVCLLVGWLVGWLLVSLFVSLFVCRFVGWLVPFGY